MEFEPKNVAFIARNPCYTMQAKGTMSSANLVWKFIAGLCSVAVRMVCTSVMPKRVLILLYYRVMCFVLWLFCEDLGTFVWMRCHWVCVVYVWWQILFIASVAHTLKVVLWIWDTTRVTILSYMDNSHLWPNVIHIHRPLQADSMCLQKGVEHFLFALCTLCRVLGIIHMEVFA